MFCCRTKAFRFGQKRQILGFRLTRLVGHRPFQLSQAHAGVGQCLREGTVSTKSARSTPFVVVLTAGAEWQQEGPEIAGIRIALPSQTNEDRGS